MARALLLPHQGATVIRAKELGGRAVVDVDAAEKLGQIDRIVLDTDGRRVAGFVVSRGGSVFGGGEHLTVSADSVHAVGPDAVTVRRGANVDNDSLLDGLPRVSDIVGRKVVSDQGRLLGTVDDVLIDETDGRIVGYSLAGADLDDKLRGLISKEQHDDGRTPFLRADADLKTGKDLIVAPESAVSVDWDTPARSGDATVPATGATWSPAMASSGRSIWMDGSQGKL